MPVTVLSFLFALLALIVAVVGLLLQMIGLWDGIGIALVALAVITLGAPAVIAGRVTQ